VRPRTLADDAEDAFREGRDRDALQFLHAYAVMADDEVATELLKKMGWVGPLSHPSFAIRWAVGVDATVPRAYEGSPFPIGVPQELPPLPGQPIKPKNGAGSHMPTPAQPRRSSWDDEQPIYDRQANNQGAGVDPLDFGGPQIPQLPMTDPFLQYAAGELAQRFVQEYSDRAERGLFGEVLSTSTSFAPEGTADAVGFGGGGSREPFHEPEGESDEYSSEGSSETGEHDEEEYDEGSGDYSDYESSDGYENGYQERPASPEAGVVPTKPRQVARGLVLVGMEKYRELLVRARSQSADLLVVFDIVIKPPIRGEIVQNDTRIEVYCVKTGKKVGATRTINNVKVQRAREADDDDGVAEELNDLFARVEQDWRMAELPRMKPEHAQGRIDTLASQQHRNPIPVLAEIRMYHTRKLLDDAGLTQAYQKILGPQQGTALAMGSEDARRQIVSRWLPRQR
jgi:hypothetical protein